MRKRRISYLSALGLALALAIPGTASAVGDQEVQAGFLPQSNASIPNPPPTANLGSNDSKHGTLFTRLFLAPGSYGTTPGNRPSSAGVFDIHAPEELTFTTKGLDQCDPAIIRGRSPGDARSLCNDAFLGLGDARVAAGSVIVSAQVSLFNGTPQGGNPTVLFHSSAGGGPVIISEMQDSPLPGYGTLFHSLVAQGAGGPIPNATPIVDTSFTLSKDFKDKKLLKKARKAKKKGNTKKARKLKKKAKKSWTQAKCTDGELRTRIEVTYVAGGGPPQSDETTQACS